MGYVSSTSALGTASTTNVINAPAGVTAGRLILLAIAVSNLGATITPPSGFTMYDQQVLSSYDSARIALMWKIAGGSEPSTYTTTMDTAQDSAAVMALFDGVTNPTTPIAAAAFANAGDGSVPIDIPSASVTPPAIGNDIVWFAGFDTYIGIHSTVYTAPTAPSGMTLRASISGANSGATSSQNMGLATGVAAAATSTAVSGGSVTNPVGSGAEAFAWVLALNAGIATATLSSPSPSGTLGTQTTAAPAVTSNTAGGTLYGVIDIPSKITGITAAQIKAGQNNLGAAALKVMAFGTPTAGINSATGITGLTAGTAYAEAFTQNTTGGDAAPVTQTFTTAIATTSVTVQLFSGGTTPLATKALKFWTRTGRNALPSDGGASGLDGTTDASGVVTLSGLTISAGAGDLEVVDPLDPHRRRILPVVYA